MTCQYSTSFRLLLLAGCLFSESFSLRAQLPRDSDLPPNAPSEAALLSPTFSARNPEGTKPATPAEAAKVKKKKPEDGGNGPTDIISDESHFNEKAHTAIFLRKVYVTTADFTISCDKLTAYLKHDDTKDDKTKAKPAVTSTPKPTPRLAPGATPRLTAPAPAAPKEEKKDQASGLDHAFAEGNVEIIQDKVEEDGKITHSVAHSKTAFYDTKTGDVTLRGKPDITQGINTTVALEESVVMVLNREGRMKSYDGRVTTVLTELSDSAKKSGAAGNTAGQ